MTVVHVTSSGNRSGGTRQAFLLARAQREAGVDVRVCAPERAAILRWSADHGIPTVGLPDLSGVRGQWRASRRLRRLVRQVAADVVHAHHTKGHNVALLATFGGRFPPVVANRGVLFRPEFPAKFRSRRTAAVITNSHAVKRVLEGCRIPGDKVHVVYNAREPVDLGAIRSKRPALREELGLGGGAVIGAVGRARPEKGFQFLVEAAPRILARHPAAWFVLVGSGTDRFLPRLRELGIADRFRLPGHRADAVDVMGVFDLFVIPSVDMESCPNVLLEAMAVGLPAVGAGTGGIPEVIRHGETGLVVPPGEPEPLAAAAAGILGDPDGARAMGRAGRARILEAFSLEAKVRATGAVYRKVLGR